MDNLNRSFPREVNQGLETNLLCLLFLPDHNSAGGLQVDLLPPWAEVLVGFHQFLADRDALGAVFLTLAAFDTERGIGWGHSEADRLEVLEAP